MKDTSERILIDSPRRDEADYYVYLLHLASYSFVARFTKDKKVLDLGCGTGYGSFALSENAEMVFGLDISGEAINYAKNKYTKQNLEFIKLNDSSLPFDDDTFNIIVSFQVIEHIKDIESYLSEIKRILKPNGQFFLSTPDKNTRLFKIQKPWNYYHIKEYSIHDLNGLLSKWFTKVEIMKIGGEEKIVSFELKRRRKTRLITLPFTISLYPTFVRKFFLKSLKKIYYAKPKVLKTDNKILDYDISDIVINHEMKQHTDLMAVCAKL